MEGKKEKKQETNVQNQLRRIKQRLRAIIFAFAKVEKQH